MVFEYPPLPKGDSLRLLILDPGDFTDPLRASIKPVAFSARPRYFALSYTWSDPNDYQALMPVSFDDEVLGKNTMTLAQMPARMKRASLHLNHGSGRLPISHNLALALHHLRSPTHPLIIWVDAVCINQADIAERNAQVALMSFIYRRATAVIVWLGIPQVADEATLVSCAVNAMADRWTHGDVRALAAALAERKPLTELRYNAGFKRELKTNPYWTRLWVVQEICLAREVVYTYGGFLWNSEQVRRAAAKGAPSMKLVIDARDQRYSDAMELANLVERFGKQGCTEIRDRIYGVLGMSHDVSAGGTFKWATRTSSDQFDTDNEGHAQIPIDYSVTLFDVWAGVVFPIAERSRKDTLGQLHAASTANLGPCPSQRPEGALVRLASAVQNALEGQVEQDLLYRPHPSYCSQHIIRLLGYETSTITRIGPSYEAYVNSTRVYRQWVASLEKDHHGEDLEKLREIEGRYYDKTIDFEQSDLDRISELENHQAVMYPDTNAGKDAYKQANEILNHRKPQIGNTSRTLAAPVRFLGSNFCTGLVPASARPGDVIVRFHGCSAAVVMRSWESPENPNWKRVSFEHGFQVPSHVCIGRADIAAPTREVRWHTIYIDLIALQKISACVETFPPR